MRRLSQPAIARALLASVALLAFGQVPVAYGATGNAATGTPTVTTPASTKIGQPTTIAPAPSQATPKASAPATGGSAAGAPAASKPTPSPAAPATTTPATTAPATTAPPTATTPPAGAGGSAITPQPGVGATPSTPGLLGRAHPKARSHAHKKISTEAIVLAAIAALLLLACAIWAFARRRAYEPHWTLSLRHAMAEAGFRASATWAEFTDWVRLGR